MLQNSDWPSIVTPVIAVLGFALGVLNTVWAISRNRTQLRIHVEPTPAHLAIPNEVHPLVVQIVNTSLFPVTLADIQVTRSWFRSPIPMNFFVPENSASWPPRLEPGATYSVQILRDNLDRPGFDASGFKKQINGIRVVTATGKGFRRRSHKLRTFLSAP